MDYDRGTYEDPYALTTSIVKVMRKPERAAEVLKAYPFTHATLRSLEREHVEHANDPSRDDATMKDVATVFHNASLGNPAALQVMNFYLEMAKLNNERELRRRG